MKEENNKEINPHAARDAAIIEALKKNDPFVLPSLEELRLQFNEIEKEWPELHARFLNILPEEKRSKVEGEIQAFEKATGILLPQDYKEIQLKYEFGFMIGSSTGISGCEELGFDLEEWIERQDEPGGVLLEDTVKIGDSEFLHYFMNVKNNKIYICDDEYDTEYHLIADSFELFLRGLFYAYINREALVVKPLYYGESIEEIDRSLLEKLIKDITKPMGVNHLDYQDYWNDVCGINMLDTEYPSSNYL